MSRIPFRKNIGYIILLWIPYIILYQMTNRFHIFEPKYLAFSWLDNTIPFLPFMIPVYISYLVYVFLTIYRSRNQEEFTSIFILSYFQVIISALFFIFFPVYYPEASFEGTGKIWETISSVWTWFDEPFNCLPSLHTSNTLLAMHFNYKKKHKIIFLCWGALIIMSTLLCKKHYVIDIAAGILLYLATVQLAGRLDLRFKIQKPRRTAG